MDPIVIDASWLVEYMAVIANFFKPFAPYLVILANYMLGATLGAWLGFFIANFADVICEPYTNFGFWGNFLFWIISGFISGLLMVATVLDHVVWIT